MFFMSVGLCIPTYHVHHNYVIYIVAVRLQLTGRLLWLLVYMWLPWVV